MPCKIKLSTGCYKNYLILSDLIFTVLLKGVSFLIYHVLVRKKYSCLLQVLSQTWRQSSLSAKEGLLLRVFFNWKELAAFYSSMLPWRFELTHYLYLFFRYSSLYYYHICTNVGHGWLVLFFKVGAMVGYWFFIEPCCIELSVAFVTEAREKRNVFCFYLFPFHGWK